MSFSVFSSSRWDQLKDASMPQRQRCIWVWLKILESIKAPKVKTSHFLMVFSSPWQRREWCGSATWWMGFFCGPLRGGEEVIKELKIRNQSSVIVLSLRFFFGWWFWHVVPFLGHCCQSSMFDTIASSYCFLWVWIFVFFLLSAFWPFGFVFAFCTVPTFCCFTDPCLALFPLFRYAERCFSCQQTVVRWVVVKTCPMESHKGWNIDPFISGFLGFVARVDFSFLISDLQ